MSRAFCVCGHSWYSHNYPMRVTRDPMRMECERVGCRCGEYAAATPSALGDHTREEQDR